MKILNKIVIFAVLTLDFVILSGAAVFAAPTVKAYDMRGKELAVAKGQITASSDVEFKLDTDLLSEDETYVFYLQDKAGGKGMIEPLEDGVYLMEEDEGEKTVCFNILDEIHGKLKEIEGGKIHVSFIDGMETEVNFGFACDKAKEVDGIVYFTGTAPSLTASPAEGVDTFISVSDTKENKKYEVREAGTRVTFPEGSYGLSVYITDGWGRIKQASLPFKQFIYDNTPPAIPQIKVSSQGNGRRSDGRLYFNGNVEIVPESSDSLSGIDGYIFRFSNAEKTAGSSLILEPMLEECPEIFAVDKAGNVSEAFYPAEEFILDSETPKLTSYRLDANASKCSVRLEYTDGFSGMRKIRVTSEENTYFSKEFSGRNINKLVSEFDVSPSELKNGKNSFKAELTDNSGNISEYDFTIEKDFGEAPKLSTEGCREDQVFTEVPVKINIGISSSAKNAPEHRIVAVRKNENGAVEWQKELSAGENVFNEEGYYLIEVVAADSEGNSSRLIRHFTIDTEAPMIAPLDEFNKRILSSFAFKGDPMSAISDYSHVDYDVFLNGQEYDGSSIEEPGKYVLKLVATDELGRSSSQKAEFIISSNEVKKGAEETTAYIIPGNNMKPRMAAPLITADKGKAAAGKINGNKYGTVKRDKDQTVKKDAGKVVNITWEEKGEIGENVEKKGIFDRIIEFFKGLTV